MCPVSTSTVTCMKTTLCTETYPWLPSSSNMMDLSRLAQVSSLCPYIMGSLSSYPFFPYPLFFSLSPSSSPVPPLFLHLLLPSPSSPFPSSFIFSLLVLLLPFLYFCSLTRCYSRTCEVVFGELRNSLLPLFSS